MIPLSRDGVNAPCVRLCWYGHSMFSIEDDAGNRVVTDPYDPDIGYGFPDLEASVVLVSHGHYDHSNAKGIKGGPAVIDVEGHSASHGLEFEGLPSAHDARDGLERGPNVIFKWEMGGLKFTHLGDLGHALDKGLQEALAGLDVLMVPVGGFYTIGDGDAAEIVRQLAPRLAVPMHFKTPDVVIPNINDASPFTARFSDVIETGTDHVYIDRASLPDGSRILLMDYVR